MADDISSDSHAADPSWTLHLTKAVHYHLRKVPSATDGLCSAMFGSPLLLSTILHYTGKTNRERALFLFAKFSIVCRGWYHAAPALAVVSEIYCSVDARNCESIWPRNAAEHVCRVYVILCPNNAPCG